jgi:DNA mismatch repair protein MutS
MLTPAMRQYAEQKAQVPDALLLFRMGDFYELFYDDARTAARVLGLTLTSRSKGDGAIPLAGIPYHALDSYLNRLVRAGFKVAISEQVEDPRQAKGVIKRELVRIVTPGTLTEDNLLEQRADNYLCCVCRDGERIGLAGLELSTGAFWVQSLGERELLDELVRLSPAELLLPESRIDSEDPLAGLVSRLRGPDSPVPGLVVTRRPAYLFEPFQAEQRLRKHFGVTTLEGFGFRGMDASLCSAAAVIDYLTETQKTALRHITRLARRLADDYVAIDQSTWRALEIERTLRGGTSSGSLVAAVDRTCTAMGARCLRRWLAAPLRKPRAIQERQEAVAALLADRTHLQLLRGRLRQLADVERITSRLGVNRASPRDLLALGRALLQVDQICELLRTGFRGQDSGLSFDTRDAGAGVWDGGVEKGGSRIEREAACPGPRGSTEAGERDRRLDDPDAIAGTPLPTPSSGASPGLRRTDEQEQGSRNQKPETNHDLPPFLRLRCTSLSGLRELGDFLTTALHPDPPVVLNEGGIIADGFDAELDRLRSIGTNGRQWLAEFQAREIRRTGIPSLKVGYNQVFGYYIEITHLHRDRVPPEYVRRQTVKNAERYITEELKKHEAEVLSAQDRIRLLEEELFNRVRRHAAERIPALQELAAAVAELDVIAGWAALADERRYVRPELADEPVLEIRDGRHPVLEQTLAEKFVPNDCVLGFRVQDAGFSESTAPILFDSPGEPEEPKPKVHNPRSEILAILTGPNMAGKSTYIRQVALLTLLAQTGCFVPAARMRLGPADRIFARIGASDEITRGQSTFMVEMTEAANILNNATPSSLVIIDELGRGTSTFDGLSLAWAIAEHLVANVGCRCLFATHYHELTQLEQYMAGVVNYNVAVREWQDEIVFLHRIVRGGTDRSYGVHVAKLAGVPPEVIRRSRDLLAELEANFSATRRAPARAARRTRRDAHIQMQLFADPADEVVDAVAKTDLVRLTPEGAWAAIKAWQERLKGRNT